MGVSSNSELMEMQKDSLSGEPDPTAKRQKSFPVKGSESSASLSNDISFTITACRRPELLDRTLASFSRGVIDANLSEFDAYINVDPLPAEVPGDKLLEIAKKYFRSVRFRTPAKANFCSAVKWVWSQPDTEFFFHLEDDWELIKPFRLGTLVRILKQRRFLPLFSQRSAVNLNVYNFADTRICLSPGLLRTSFGHYAATHLDEKYNPERQLRIDNAMICPTIPGLKAFKGHFYGGKQNVQFCRDIGREWRERHKVARFPDDPRLFTTWDLK